MSQVIQRVRSRGDRVGMLSNAGLPPPASNGVDTTGARSSDARSADALLFSALRDRDESAFVQVLDLYYGPMLRIATTYVRSSATAEEVVQDTWLAALRGIGGFEGRSSVRTWLFRILRNIARTRGQREARVTPFSEMRPDAPASQRAMQHEEILAEALWMKPAPCPEAALALRELRARIDAAIETLPRRQREVIVRRDIQEWTSDEVCHMMGITQTNQRVLLHRARERVRDAITATRTPGRV